MSNYVVIARLDEAKEKQINDLNKEFSKCAGYTVPEWPPHITIAAYENIYEAHICEWTSEFASKHTQIKIGMHSLSIFPPGGDHSDTAVLCLNPSHSKTLVNFYYDFHRKYEEYCTGIGWFNSIVHDMPVMHATIGITTVAKIQQCIEQIFKHEVFGEALISALEVYTYPMKLIKRINLV